MLGIVWFIALAWKAGEHQAKDEAEFYVRPGPPELAVLRIYDGKLVVFVPEGVP